MAGAGARLFPANSKLTSEQVNTYLMDQTIMRFATTAARDAAFGGAGEPTLAEGMTCYIDADNTIYTYDGSNWVKMVSASNPPALELITTYNNSGSTEYSIDDLFSSAYRNYRLVYEAYGNQQLNTMWIQFRDTTPSNIGAGYYGSIYGQDFTTASTAFQTATSNSVVYVGWLTNASAGGYTLSGALEIGRPYQNTPTNVTGQFTGIRSGNAYLGGYALANLTSSTICQGLRFGNSAAGTLGLRFSLYGYRE